jgi:hypothetical protein
MNRSRLGKSYDSAARVRVSDSSPLRTDARYPQPPEITDLPIKQLYELPETDYHSQLRHLMSHVKKYNPATLGSHSFVDHSIQVIRSKDDPALSRSTIWRDIFDVPALSVYLEKRREQDADQHCCLTSTNFGMSLPTRRSSYPPVLAGCFLERTLCLSVMVSVTTTDGTSSTLAWILTWNA